MWIGIKTPHVNTVILSILFSLVAREIFQAEKDLDTWRENWCKRHRSLFEGTEMQENTWARLRESSTHQGASHAT